MVHASVIHASDFLCATPVRALLEMREDDATSEVSRRMSMTLELAMSVLGARRYQARWIGREARAMSVTVTS
jgi:hypothetical protein